jgi:hypothetical protein
MDDRLTDFVLRALAVLLVIGGLVTVLIGYLGVRNHDDIVLQVPYFMSGGVGGLALMGLGALAFVQYQMRLQARRFAQMTESLEEWKEAALAEVRGFLEGAQLEVEILEPSSRTIRSRRAGVRVGDGAS